MSDEPVVTSLFSDREPAYSRKLGAMYKGDSSKLLGDLPPNSIDLIVTSPPFALQHEKEYGNEPLSEYNEWFMENFAGQIQRVLQPHGSFVLEIGGAFKPGVPERSTYQFDLLSRLTNADDSAYNDRPDGLHLSQDVYWMNTAKLPSPIEWVNVRKFRITDAVTPIWWLSKEINKEPARTKETMGKLKLVERVAAELEPETAAKIVESILRGSPISEGGKYYTSERKELIEDTLPELADEIHKLIESTNKTPSVFARKVIAAVEEGEEVPYPQPKPEANNQRALREYSESHKELIETGEYNEGKRPSGWNIGADFGNDNNGAIPKNYIEAANTASNTKYQEFCKRYQFKKHPARFVPDVPEFFIKFLTPNPPYDDWDRGRFDRPVVLDIFAGSNLTGSIAQELGRYWLSFEKDEDEDEEEEYEYIKSSELRFMDHEEAEQRYGHRVEDENTSLSGFDGESSATSN